MASMLALRELAAAMKVLDTSNDLPDRRLALVRQHVELAGTILHTTEQITTQSDLAVEEVLTQLLSPQIEEMRREKQEEGPRFGFGEVVKQMEESKAPKVA